MAKHTPLKHNEVAPGIYEYMVERAAVRPVRETAGYVATLADLKPTLEEALLISWGIAYNEKRFPQPRWPFAANFAAFVAEIVEAEPDEMVSIIDYVRASHLLAERRKRRGA